MAIILYKVFIKKKLNIAYLRLFKIKIYNYNYKYK